MQKATNSKPALFTELRRLAEQDATKLLKLECMRMAHELYEAGIVTGSAKLADGLFEMEIVPSFDAVRPPSLLFRCSPVASAKWEFDLDSPRLIRKKRPDLTIRNFEIRRSYVMEEKSWVVFEGIPAVSVDNSFFSLEISFVKNTLPRIWLSPSSSN